MVSLGRVIMGPMSVSDGDVSLGPVIGPMSESDGESEPCDCKPCVGQTRDDLILVMVNR